MGDILVMKSNFNFLMNDMDTEELHQKATEIEKLYTQELYSQEISSIRIILENIAQKIVDFNYLKLNGWVSFDDYLRTIKNKQLIDLRILDLFYDLKRVGNKAAHSLDNATKEEGLNALEQLNRILIWFVNTYMLQNESADNFFEPRADNLYQTSERKLIYVQSTKNEKGLWQAYAGSEKIGDASIEGYEIDNRANSDDLRNAAEKRINQYMKTAGVPHQLNWAELAYRKTDNFWFRDHDVHRVLERSGIKRNENVEGKEWFLTNTETVKRAITAVKENRTAIDINSPKQVIKITLRQEQLAAIEQTKKVFKTKNKMLWNAKMRFGKTLTALQLIKDQKYQRILITTHRPVVSDSWFEDFNKIEMREAGYVYSSKNSGRTLDEAVESHMPFIYFASLQDLRGSEVFGGKSGVKNQQIADINWDLVIVDEAHEGTMTDLATNVLTGIIKKQTKLLELSGTPFNIMDQYDEEQVFTWDYVMEQQAKKRWSVDHPKERNPYEGLPEVSMYTFEMKRNFKSDSFLTTEGKSFNFKEFFRVNEDGQFVYEDKVNGFLNNITRPDVKTNYPFSTLEFRNELRHTLWLMPGIKEAAAMKELLEHHPVFGMEYKVINVVDNGDTRDGTASETDLERVRGAISEYPEQTKTITLTVRKLTTGVNVKEWNAVMFLSNTNSATTYLQAAFRAQTPFSNEKLGMKKKAYIFDFAPDRALSVMAESSKMNSGAGKLSTTEQKARLKLLLNFLPIIGEQGNGMQPYRVDTLLTKLKHVYAEKAVRTGFDDDSLYNDQLLKLDTDELDRFNNLKATVGTTKSEKKPNKIDVNQQGLTDEEYDQAEKAKKKNKKERTEEEKAALAKMNELKKQRKTFISVLRGISIRIPLMIYGLDIDVDRDVKINDFMNLVDTKSWEEFMPKGVTKEIFKHFSRYYDSEIFIEAGRIIRQRTESYDEEAPLERVEDIAGLFSTFKNPDKETVLTPWNVVNRHLAMTIGGLKFFDDDFKEITKNGVNIRDWVETTETSVAFSNSSRLLEINSKTGLYPLYAAASLYYKAFEKMNEQTAGRFNKNDEEQLWQDILNNNIYVIAKTPMAKIITDRTLTGYKNYKTNIKYIDEIVTQAKTNISVAADRIKKEFDNVKFDVVIGNPPYQEMAKGNSTGDDPIYHLFFELAFEISGLVTLITPARFLSNAGKTPTWWNKKMLTDKHFKVSYFQPDSNKIFPRTDIKGGVAITLRDESKDFGAIGIFTKYKELECILKKVNNKLDKSMSEIIYNQNKYNLERVYADYPELKKEISSSGRDKRLRSNSFEKLAKIFSKEKLNPKDINILGIINNKRTSRYIKLDYLDEMHENLYKFKVILPKSNGAGKFGEIISTPLVVGPMIGYTGTFIGVGAFKSEFEANATLKYVKTKFLRTMLGVLKVTQDNPIGVWKKVPLQNFTTNSDIDWKQSVADIDQQLYAKYGLTEQEVNFIETKVKEMS